MKLEKFNELYKLNIINDVEKDYKGLSYLSWATAYKLAMEQDPTMTYEILEDQDGIPFFSRGEVHIVKTQVTMFGETKKMILPVMDNKHNAVSKPNARQINDNVMRCLTKNIAMFGIGLPLYVKEDLLQFNTHNIEEHKKIDELKNKILKSLTEEDDEIFNKVIAYYGKNNIDELDYKELTSLENKLKKEREKRGVENEMFRK